ncbi:hypothetical protein SAMN05444355_1402 [Flavobacterium frigoris]|uniref:Lipoprotein n=1 Tax=Flavobacterium frigoris TaxID=229204 RepID=A0A1H9S366_FLAFI|nr:hypothetical protein SAMN05444355_1402 [Flavobacterium frigoris]
MKYKKALMLEAIFGIIAIIISCLIFDVFGIF